LFFVFVCFVYCLLCKLVSATMKHFFTLFFFFLVVSSILAHEEEEELRLIAFSETQKEWLPFSVIEKLMANRINFMDITDHQEVVRGALLGTLAPIPEEPRHKPLVDGLLPTLSATNIGNTISTLSNNYFTRYYTSQTGVESAQWIFDQFVTYSKGRADITVEKYAHTWIQPSIIATIKGLGPNQNELVIVGGHEDSVGTSSTARAPGADDDASGVSTLLEVFRALIEANYYPDRTVKFITYAGEEAGLLGSQVIANDFRNQGLLVHAVLQLDMTAYGSGDIGIMTDFVDANLTNFVRILVDTYASLGWANRQCGYACSDHASWYRSGYRVSFPFEAISSNPYIHTANDVIGNISPTRSLEFAKVGLAFVIELADTVPLP